MREAVGRGVEVEPRYREQTLKVDEPHDDAMVD